MVGEKNMNIDILTRIKANIYIETEIFVPGSSAVNCFTKIFTDKKVRKINQLLIYIACLLDHHCFGIKLQTLHNKIKLKLVEIKIMYLWFLLINVTANCKQSQRDCQEFKHVVRMEKSLKL